MESQIWGFAHSRENTWQIYLLRQWREAVPVPLALALTERDELGPECTKTADSTLISVGDYLSLSQRAEVSKLWYECSDVFILPYPRCTNLIEHHTETALCVVVHIELYCLPQHERAKMENNLTFEITPTKTIISLFSPDNSAFLLCQSRE